MPDSFFPTQSGAPQMPQIFNDQALRNAGVQVGWRDYTDNYANAAMSQFNNEYNYWLWQQQALYNSPAEQVKRLQEAGLNPNYNAIEGAGNLKDNPYSRADVHSNVGESGRQNLMVALQYSNAILNAVKEGIDLTSQISSLPSDIGTYRHYVSELMKQNVMGKKSDNAIKAIENAFDLKTKLGINPEGISIESAYGPGIVSPASAHKTVFNEPYVNPNWSNSVKAQLLRYQANAASVLEDLRNGQISINDQRLKNLSEQERLLKSDANSRDALNQLKTTAPWIGIITDILKLFIH